MLKSYENKKLYTSLVVQAEEAINLVKRPKIVLSISQGSRYSSNMLSPVDMDYTDDRSPLLSQRGFDRLEIRFVDCLFTYTELANLPAGSSENRKKLSLKERAMNKFEKVARNAVNISKGEDIDKRYEDCIYGVGDNKIRIQNQISKFNIPTKLKFIRCNFVNREIGCFEKFWNWLYTTIFGGTPFLLESNGEGQTVLEIQRDTLILHDLPSTVHQLIQRIQGTKV